MLAITRIRLRLTQCNAAQFLQGLNDTGLTRGAGDKLIYARREIPAESRNAVPQHADRKAQGKFIGKQGLAREIRHAVISTSKG